MQSAMVSWTNLPSWHLPNLQWAKRCKFVLTTSTKMFVWASRSVLKVSQRHIKFILMIQDVMAYPTVLW